MRKFIIMEHEAFDDKTAKSLRFVAFLATEYDEVLSGYQRGQMVE